MPDEAASGRGHIELICGCMFSGKSERLLARMGEARAASKRVVAFKHASDDRYSATQIVTHAGQRTEAFAVPTPAAIAEHVGDAHLVAIDEAQFFGDELVDLCRELTGRGVDVVLAGLDLDSWGQPFGPMPVLEAMADRVTRARATCSVCGEPADHTQRLAPVGDTDMIGGPEAYEPRCAEHFVPPPAELRR